MTAHVSTQTSLTIVMEGVLTTMTATEFVMHSNSLDVLTLQHVTTKVALQTLTTLATTIVMDVLIPRPVTLIHMQL